MQREGSFREMKRHVHFEKPSEKRARQKAEAIRRARKLARKRMQREGLLPAPSRAFPAVVKTPAKAERFKAASFGKRPFSLRFVLRSVVEHS